MDHVFRSTRLTEEEDRKLGELARRTHRSKSAIVRYLLALAQTDDLGNIVLTPTHDRR